MGRCIFLRLWRWEECWHKSTLQRLMCSLLVCSLIFSWIFQRHDTNLKQASATGVGGWEDALDRAKEFVAQLNLTEKANIVTGTLRGSCAWNIVPIDQLNYTGLCMQDGPNAIRIADLASLFSQV